jgi:VanZ family protein
MQRPDALMTKTLETTSTERALRRRSRWALWGCVLAVAVLAFAPSADPPGASWDKANHLLAFAVMAWLADLGWPGRQRALSRWGLLLGYGLLIEGVQHLIPMRHFSLLDLAADAVGILIYLGLKAGWQRLFSRSDGSR